MVLPLSVTYNGWDVAASIACMERWSKEMSAIRRPIEWQHAVIWCSNHFHQSCRAERWTCSYTYIIHPYIHTQLRSKWFLVASWMLQLLVPPGWLLDFQVAQPRWEWEHPWMAGDPKSTKLNSWKVGNLINSSCSIDSNCGNDSDFCWNTSLETTTLWILWCFRGCRELFMEAERDTSCTVTMRPLDGGLLTSKTLLWEFFPFLLTL